MDKHIKSCTKRDTTMAPAYELNITEHLNQRLVSMEENLTFLRKSLNEEIQMRHDLIVEMGTLKKRNQVSALE
jgi:hypothetical protein